MIGAHRTGCWLAVPLLLLACSERRLQLVDDPIPDAGNASRDARAERDTGLPPTAAVDAAAPITPPPDAGSPARCGNRACACSDGSDDDRDGLIDGLDPECTAAFDDDEASFATGLPIKTGGCRDCFWDNNAGQGDDGCRYPEECLTGAAPNGNGNCSSCDVSDRCIDACAARTPNGCDCFGCCEVVRSSGEHVFIELRDSCRLADLDVPELCPRCVQNTDCANPCGRCELCLGKTVDKLPADCAQSNGGRAYRCEDGRDITCGTSADCAGTEYCQLGCCLVDLL